MLFHCRHTLQHSTQCLPMSCTRFIADTPCSTVHSVCPCPVLISLQTHPATQYTVSAHVLCSFHCRHTLQHRTQCLPMSCAHFQYQFWTFQCQANVYTQAKQKPSTQLSADRFSSVLISEHRPTSNTHTVQAGALLRLQLHTAGSQFFFHMLRVFI